MKCATATAHKLTLAKPARRGGQADRDAAGLRLLSSAVNYLQRNYWRLRGGGWGWESEAHTAAFGVLVSASFRIQAEKMRRQMNRHLIGEMKRP